MKTSGGLDYDERGRGEVVYLVHAGVFGAWFAPLFEQHALDGFRVIRPVRPGYSRGPAPTEPTSLAEHARACGELLRRLDVERAYWVGHSSSCCIGLQLALDEPDLVTGLILFEPARPSGQLRDVAARTYVGQAMTAARAGDVSGAFDVFLRGVGGDDYRAVLQSRFGEQGVARAEREAAYFFAQEMPALAAWEFGPDEAARVSAPSLLLFGGETRPWFRENVEILASMLPNARTQRLPGLGHLAPLTNPSDFAVAIAQFVGSPATTAR